MKNLRWDDIKRLALQPKFILIVCAVILVYSFVFEKSGLVRQLELIRENRELRSEIDLMQKRVLRIQEEIHALETDIEKIKAEAIKNGWAEPDEVIIKVR